MLPPQMPAKERESTISHSAAVWFSRPELQRKQHVGKRRARGADQQDRAGGRCRSDSRPQIGAKMNCMAENDGDDDADDEAVRAEVPAVNRHQRHHDAEPDQVNEDRQENDQDGRLSHEGISKRPRHCPRRTLK